MKHAGLLTSTIAGTTKEELVSLQYEALARLWPRLNDWLRKRVLFRDAALSWHEHGRNRGTLFAGALLEEAENYQDLNRLEREFVTACRKEAIRLAATQRMEVRNWMIVAGVIGLLLLAVVCLGIQNRVATNALIKSEQDARESWRRAEDLNTQVALLRALGDMAGAETEVELSLSNKEWEILSKRAESVGGGKVFLGEFKEAINGIVGRSRDGGKGIMSQAERNNVFNERNVLILARTMGEEIRSSGSEDALRQLNQLRSESYGLVRFLGQRLVAEAGYKAHVFELRPYIRKFWKLYWGEMGMFEGQLVKEAMVRFGHILTDWQDDVHPLNLRMFKESLEILEESLDLEERQPLQPLPRGDKRLASRV
jgi:hypothetical protein